MRIKNRKTLHEILLIVFVAYDNVKKVSLKKQDTETMKW